MKYILVWGNPFDGMEIIGPFDDHHTATIYAEHDRDISNSEWWVKLLQEPSFAEGDYRHDRRES